MVMNNFSLNGQVALVTGAGRGIGKGIATALAGAGADLVCTARTVSELEASSAEIRSLGHKVLGIPCDVRDSQQIENMVKKAKEEFGHIDILVNNAGHAAPFTPALLTSEEIWEGELRENLTSVFLCSKAVALVMMERKKGVIINISSQGTEQPTPGIIGYGAAKAGVSHLTRTLAFELAPYIRVNAICPGAIWTEGGAPFIEPIKAQIEKYTPLKRLGQPEDIGLLALFLVSSASGYITGRTFSIDGGIEFMTSSYDGMFFMQ